MCILVVEDDFLIRTILVEELIEAGHLVEQAETGERALGLLRGLERPISVLITDVQMPGTVDGVRLATLLREAQPGLPVIFTTGRPDALCDRVRLDDRQMLVRKPYRPDEIIDRVEALTR